MLLQRVTRKSLYRFRTSLGGSSSAGCLSQHFVIMRIRLIPIKRNQKTGKKKENPATAHHIKHTTITQHSTPHYHHPNAPCYANTHYTDTQYTTTLHYIPHTTTTPSHTLLPHYYHTNPFQRYMLHQHAYTNTCYTFTLHSTHHLEPTGFPFSLHNMLYSTTHRKLMSKTYMPHRPQPRYSISSIQLLKEEIYLTSYHPSSKHRATHVMHTHAPVHTTPLHHDVQVTGHEQSLVSGPPHATSNS